MWHDPYFLFLFFDLVISEFCKECFDHIHPFPNYSQIYILLPYSVNFAFIYLWICAYPWGRVDLPAKIRRWKTVSSFQLPTAHQLGMRTHVHLCSMLGFGVAWGFTGFVHIVIVTMSSSMQLPCCLWRTWFPCCFSFPLAISVSLLQWSLSLGKRVYDIDITIWPAKSLTLCILIICGTLC